jgi:hypothetical protein
MPIGFVAVAKSVYTVNYACVSVSVSQYECVVQQSMRYQLIGTCRRACTTYTILVRVAKELRNNNATELVDNLPDLRRVSQQTVIIGFTHTKW